MISSTSLLWMSASSWMNPTQMAVGCVCIQSSAQGGHILSRCRCYCNINNTTSMTEDTYCTSLVIPAPQTYILPSTVVRYVFVNIIRTGGGRGWVSECTVSSMNRLREAVIIRQHFCILID